MEEFTDISYEGDEDSVAVDEVLSNYINDEEDREYGDGNEDVPPIVSMRKLVTPKLNLATNELLFHD